MGCGVKENIVTASVRGNGRKRWKVAMQLGNPLSTCLDRRLCVQRPSAAGLVQFIGGSVARPSRCQRFSQCALKMFLCGHVSELAGNNIPAVPSKFSCMGMCQNRLEYMQCPQIFSWVGMCQNRLEYMQCPQFFSWVGMCQNRLEYMQCPQNFPGWACVRIGWNTCSAHKFLPGWAFVRIGWK